MAHNHELEIADSRRNGVGIADARRIAELEREVRKLRRANALLKGRGEIIVRSTRASPSAVGGLDADEPPARGSRKAPPMVEIRVLGPAEALVGGRSVDLGTPKQRALLTLLASHMGRLMTIDMIVEELWAGHAPPSAIASLQVYVANLRRVLEPGRAPRTPATVLRTSGQAYLLDSRYVEVDVQLFTERAVSGLRALDRDDPQRVLSEFEAALALWRGQAYAEIADAESIAPDVARLQELRLSVMEGRCAALLGVGAHAMAVAELEAFTQAHPLREYGYELLSVGLYRAGRQADALAVLRANQKRLAEELGIDPGPALQRIEKEILNQAPTLDWRPRGRVPQWVDRAGSGRAGQ
jgi:DNA-binding SARP family transcriptional activator